MCTDAALYCTVCSCVLTFTRSDRREWITIVVSNRTGARNVKLDTSCVFLPFVLPLKTPFLYGVRRFRFIFRTSSSRQGDFGVDIVTHTGVVVLPHGNICASTEGCTHVCTKGRTGGVTSAMQLGVASVNREESSLHTRSACAYPRTVVFCFTCCVPLSSPHTYLSKALHREQGKAKMTYNPSVAYRCDHRHSLHAVIC